jgi:hypothetical protein
MPTSVENALFSAMAYDKQPNDELRRRLSDRWKVLSVDSRLLDNPATGFCAHVYHDEAMREVVIAFAGTHMADRRD